MIKQISRQIKKIESKEKKGAYGQWRREFCAQYVPLLDRIRKNTHTSLGEALAKTGERITCQKGCTHCCFHYVAVSLAHGVVIVDYLYENKGLLKQFLNNYGRWHHRGYDVANSIDQIRLQSLSSQVPVDRVIADTRPLSGRYLDMNIQCPFLMDNRCYIYDVRPLACSGHYAVSPPDWCSPTEQQRPTIHHLVPNDTDLIDIVQLSDPRLTLYELSLPFMIKKLLTAGSAVMMNEITQYNF